MEEQNYLQKYERILLKSAVKAKLIKGVFGYGSERLSKTLEASKQQLYGLRLEMEDKGISTRPLNSRKLLTLEEQLFSLGVKNLQVQLAA